MYQRLIAWIGLIFVYFCHQISRCEYPIKAYEDNDSYKIFVNEVGILNTLVNIDAVNLMIDSNYMFKEVVAKNYVADKLVVNGFYLLYYTEKK